MNAKEYVLSGNVVDVVQQRVFKGVVTIRDGCIASIEERDVATDAYILPGLVNAHVHIESSMLTPGEFAKMAVPHGTVATVSDPHEIANICGLDGIEYMIRDAEKVPLKFHFGAPSCVPATGFERAGSDISAREVESLLARKESLYLSEMMNFPGVIFKDKEVHLKLEAAKKIGKPIDGHAPGLSGDELKLYVEAGISTDHECTTIEEATDKILLGMKIQIREGSAAKNFEKLHPLIESFPDAVMLCTDDTHPDDLEKGHVNHILRDGVKKGLNIFKLLRAATLNPIEHYGLNVGLLQEGDPADLIIVDNLEEFNVLSTLIDGHLVYDGSSPTFVYTAEEGINNFNCKAVKEKDIVVGVKEGDFIRVIEAIDGELITNELHVPAKVKDGEAVSDPDNDVLKIVVINRYEQAQPTVGFIKNFGLKSGAIAGSIAHDSHNIIAVGTSDEDIVNVVNEIIRKKGGIGISEEGSLKILPLPVGGIMSNLEGTEVSKRYKELNNKVVEMGSKLKAPFMTLSFMALLVIPSLKIGDRGLFNGELFEFTDLIVKK